MNKTITKYYAEDGAYTSPSVYTFSDNVKVEIFADLNIDFSLFKY